MDVVKPTADLDLAARAVESVESMLEGVEQAAARDPAARWLDIALLAPNDALYRGLVSFILRLAFVRLAEARGLLAQAYPSNSDHMSVHQTCAILAARPTSASAPGVSYGAYAHLLQLFQAIYKGALPEIPAHGGKLFQPSQFLFLEGHPGGELPKIDDAVVATVLHQLVAFQDPNLDIEHLGTLYESLMGYQVKRINSPAARVGKRGVWVEVATLKNLAPNQRPQWLRTTCGVSKTQQETIEAQLQQGVDNLVCAQKIAALGPNTSHTRRWAPGGSLVLVSGKRRRLSGSHYTPRALTQRITRRTLAPILAALGASPTVDQLLGLKICDPAMGSGAFLLEACRQLSEHVVAAWQRFGRLEEVTLMHGAPVRYARFLVAQHSLFGVDKNPDAVELARLSLWLMTASRGRAFTFVDHTLRHGDALVGLDRDQVLGFSWHRRSPVTAITALANPVPLPADTRQSLRLIADLCVGAFFAHTTTKARNLERDQRLTLVTRWLAGETQLKPRLTRLAATIRARHAPFHWWLEFPRVFAGHATEAKGMDTMIGNPPFGGNNMIVAVGGPSYQAWLKHTFKGERGVRGNCDISAFFLRQAAKHIGNDGTFGFLATNTIAQGASRAIGLKHLLAQGWQVYDASTTVAWPGAASVVVSIVVLARGRPNLHVAPQINGLPTRSVNSRLHPQPERADASVLQQTQGHAFIGSYVLGKGFILSPQTYATLLHEDHTYTKIIRPYIGGHEVNTNPGQRFDRYVIDFAQRSLTEAERWPSLLQILRTRVKPQRDKLRGNAAAGYRRRFWWRFAGAAPELYSELAKLDRCLVAAIVSKHLIFSFQPTDRVFSHKLCVVTLSSFTAFAILQSRMHVAWAWLLSSTMKTDLNYSPATCFGTFAFPRPNLQALLPGPEDTGQRFYEARSRWMSNEGVGLTKTYNALLDPAITTSAVLDLRSRTEAMDRAVLKAYGWEDLSVPPFCPQTPGQTRAVQVFKDEIIDRLYYLNRNRYREEHEQQSKSQAVVTPRTICS